jgi:hypothetical protein
MRPKLCGRAVRWRLSTIEEWEANGRPRVSPSLHEEELGIKTSQMLDLMLELALLIDEAGQWHGPPLEGLPNNEDAAMRQWGKPLSDFALDLLIWRLHRGLSPPVRQAGR